LKILLLNLEVYDKLHSEEKIMKIIVGGIIEKDGKYLLAQEAKVSIFRRYE
jgi:hypothetical protein